MPKISIIIPSFNRENVISETIESVRTQTFQDWECLVVDDGSTDNTNEIVKSYVAQDPRISLHFRPEDRLKGACACRNIGFELSRGEYVKFLDSDDLLMPECLEIQFGIMNKNQNINICLSYGRFFNHHTKQLENFWSKKQQSTDFLYDHITNNIRWQTADPLWRKSFFKGFPFREGLICSQEWLMHGQSLLRLKNDEIYNLQQCLILIRQGNLRMSSERSSKYHKVQKQARIFLLKDLIKHKIVRKKYYYQLLIQIMHYFFYEIKKNYSQKYRT